MSKIEAITYLYKRGLISESKAYALAKSRNLTESETAELKARIEAIKNPPLPNDEDTED